MLRSVDLLLFERMLCFDKLRFRFDANSIEKCLKVRSCLYMILDVVT